MRLPNEPEPPYQINIVPMIDVIFAILTFFIMSTLFFGAIAGVARQFAWSKNCRKSDSKPGGGDDRCCWESCL